MKFKNEKVRVRGQRMFLGLGLCFVLGGCYAFLNPDSGTTQINDVVVTGWEARKVHIALIVIGLAKVVIGCVFFKEKSN